MAFGEKAKDPTRPYLVYAFAWRGRMFYVGVAQVKSTRHTHRWKFVENLVRHEQAGTLVELKRRELVRTSNAVLAHLIRCGAEANEVRVLWEGIGRPAAVSAEKRLIEEHLQSGCKLANAQGVRKKNSAQEVLRYLQAPSVD